MMRLMLLSLGLDVSICSRGVSSVPLQFTSFSQGLRGLREASLLTQRFNDDALVGWWLTDWGVDTELAQRPAKL